ncbi:MAG: TolC family protein [Candidatus Zixiibacteriota bacterium]
MHTPSVSQAVLLGGLLAVVFVPPARSRDLTLQEALDIGLSRTMRGEMIEGNLEVAQQLYSARRINMYLPEISINGSLPSFRKSLAYQPFRNPLDRQPFKTRNLDFSSFIELKQTLVTGGTLTATADLTSEDNRYPDTRYDPVDEVFVDQLRKQGSFSFSLAQPLFRPSSVKNELHNREDDLKIAEVTRLEETTALKKEITEAYLGTLQLALQAEIAGDKLKKASLQEHIDSAKLSDGVLSEEGYLLTGSARLDAELEGHSVENQLGEQRRELATLLDFDATDTLNLALPPVPTHIDEATRQRLIADWENAAPIKKAEHQYAKAKREADYAAAGHGVTGDLAASYSFGKQRIETERAVDADGARETTEEDVSTNSWTVALQVKVPLWDGGAGSAAVRAARYQAEQDRYEFTRAQRSARAKIINLINELDVSYQRLAIINKQIGLAEERLAIAQGRFADGRISELTLLESRTFLLETRDRYLEELKKYLLNRIDLESKYLS